MKIAIRKEKKKYDYKNAEMGIWFWIFMCLRANEWKLKIKRICRRKMKLRARRDCEVASLHHHWIFILSFFQQKYTKFELKRKWEFRVRLS